MIPLRVDEKLLNKVADTVEEWTKKVHNWTPKELALVAICRFLELQKETNEKISPKNSHKR